MFLGRVFLNTESKSHCHQNQAAPCSTEQLEVWIFRLGLRVLTCKIFARIPSRAQGRL